MKLAVQDISGKEQGELEVKFQLVEGGKGTQAVHDTVVAYMANQRRGTACTKNVGEVAGTNKKPWRQKGTGRARAGSFQSPLWRGGGVVFGPRPRDFGKKVGRKTRLITKDAGRAVCPIAGGIPPCCRRLVPSVAERRKK